MKKTTPLGLPALVLLGALGGLSPDAVAQDGTAAVPPVAPGTRSAPSGGVFAVTEDDVREEFRGVQESAGEGDVTIEEGPTVPSSPGAAVPSEVGGLSWPVGGAGGSPVDGLASDGALSGESGPPPGGLLDGLRGRILGGVGGLDPSRPGGGLAVSEEERQRIEDLERVTVDAFSKSRMQEAVRHLNDLITMRPYEADYHFALGLCYRKGIPPTGPKWREALKKYQDVLDLGGPKALIALLTAEVYAAQDPSVNKPTPDLDLVPEETKRKIYDALKEAAIGGRNIFADVKNMPLLRPFERDTDFIKLALQLERFEVTRRGAMDPFTNVFRRGVTGPGNVASGAQKGDGLLSVAEQGKLLREAKQLFERIQFYIRLQNEDKAMGAYIRMKEMVAQRKQITVPRIEKEFRDLVSRLPDVEVQISGIRLRYYYNQATAKLKAIREVFEDGDYARVQQLHVELENLAREMKAANAGYQRVADEILQRSSNWVARARVRLEFESQKPNIQGIIISGDGKMTILNGRIVKQGESLGRFRVVRIESNRVSFSYKGEEIPMVFRRY